MWRKKNPFRYVSFNVNDYANLVPAKSAIPKWYRDLDRYIDPYPPKDARHFVKSVKACFPFLDALTGGYLVLTSCDIVVSRQNNDLLVTWTIGGDNSVLAIRELRTVQGLPIPEDCHPAHYVWKFPVSFVVPKGYSALVTHPFNRFDLPFISMSGIIDSEYVLAKEGNVPFFLKKNFEGVIPQGTPIAQILPFKQESWKAIEDKGLEREARLNDNRAMSVLEGWYKSNFWNKKSYE